MVIQNNGMCRIFEKLPLMNPQRCSVRQDMDTYNRVRHQNRQQLRDLGVEDTWLMLMCLHQKMWKEHRCLVPPEIWSKIVYFALGMNIVSSSNHDGVSRVRGISGESFDDGLRRLLENGPLTPTQQENFDGRFAVVPHGDGTVGVRVPRQVSPDDVKSVAPAFANCSFLTSVVIPEFHELGPLFIYLRGVALLRAVIDEAVRALSNEARQIPYNQRWFDQRFGLVPVDDSSRPVRGPQ